tara:strand:- start:58 stop:570 length:513 start_codon:yes stop_codon:yes gene_type:complete
MASIIKVDTIQDATGAFEHARLVQVVTQTYSTQTTTTDTTIPMDTSIPQKTEGVALTSLAITPTNTNNTLIIDWVAPVTTNTSSGRDTYLLFKDDDAGAIQACFGESSSASYCYYEGMRHIVTGSLGTSEITWKIRIGTSAGTMEMNRVSSGLTFGGIIHCTFTIAEIRA